MGYLEETGADEYRPTNFTRCLSLPVISGGYPGVLSTARAPILFHEYARAATSAPLATTWAGTGWAASGG